MRYTQRVAIQQPVEVRDASGGVSATWETVEGLDSVPAYLVHLLSATGRERHDDEMTVVVDSYQIILGGQHPSIRPEMSVLAGTQRYNIRSAHVKVERGQAQTLLVADILEPSPAWQQA